MAPLRASGGSCRPPHGHLLSRVERQTAVTAAVTAAVEAQPTLLRFRLFLAWASDWLPGGYSNHSPPQAASHLSRPGREDSLSDWPILFALYTSGFKIVALAAGDWTARFRKCCLRRACSVPFSSVAQIRRRSAPWWPTWPGSGGALSLPLPRRVRGSPAGGGLAPRRTTCTMWWCQGEAW